MRRVERRIVKGALLVGGATALIDVLLQGKELKDMGLSFSWDNYNGERTMRRGLIGAGIGGALGYAYHSYQIRLESEMPFNSDGYLKKILTQEDLKANPVAFKRAIAAREEIKLWLVNKFGNRLVAWPEDAGSFYKRTAIASNYDLDIVLPFGRNSYSTLDEMYYDVYGVLENGFGTIATVTKQTKAIGLTYENNGNPIHLDIVPGREINNYAAEKDLNLFVRPDWPWERGKSFKTNVAAQKGMTVNKPEARTVIKLLKIYRNRNGLPLPTLIIEQCVVGALSENNFGVFTSATQNLLNAMFFISKKLERKNLIDVANSNNNLIDKLTDNQKGFISTQLRKDIKSIEENPRYLKEIFDC